MESIRDLAQFYKALGDETRLQLVILLARQQSGQAFCVGCLAQILDVTPSAVSQHLRVLKDLGLVQADRQGYRIHYYLDGERLAGYRHMAGSCLGAELVPSAAGDIIIEDTEEADTMCCSDRKCGCHHPEKHKAHTEECSPEQIRDCHGDAAEHPCECGCHEDDCHEGKEE